MNTGIHSREIRGKKTGFHSTQSVSNKICLLSTTTGCFTLPFYSTEIRVSRSDQDSYVCSLFWTVARLLAVAMLLPQGNARRGEFEKLSVSALLNSCGA